jgi:hypothetical protein
MELYLHSLCVSSWRGQGQIYRGSVQMSTAGTWLSTSWICHLWRQKSKVHCLIKAEKQNGDDEGFWISACQRFNVQVSGEAWVVPTVRHHKMERRSTFLLKRRRIDFHFVKSGTVMLRKLLHVDCGSHFLSLVQYVAVWNIDNLIVLDPKRYKLFV